MPARYRRGSDLGAAYHAGVTHLNAAPTVVSMLAGHPRTMLARYKVPKRFVFGELPKTATGKIQKFMLREKCRRM